MLFGRFNTPFEPAETEFDWLSRDRAEVARYVADPLCGFVLSVGGLCDLALALRRIFASPKSRIFTGGPSKMLVGLMSRWTTPFPCA